MSTIKNNYNSCTIVNDQIGIAVEDFEYGSMVPIRLPSLVPFYSKNSARTSIKTNNIMNVNKLKFNSQASSQDYIMLYIPKELYRPDSSPIPYKGYKGDKFVITFLGGNIEKPIALRRI